MSKTKSIGLFLASLFIAGLTLAPVNADAQIRRRGDGRINQGRRQWIVRPLVIRTERESNAFRAWFERSASRRNADLKRNVQRLDESLERLRARASDSRPGIGRAELQQALGYARNLDTRIFRRVNNRTTVREWTDLRRTLNELARLYGVRGV